MHTVLFTIHSEGLPHEEALGRILYSLIEADQDYPDTFDEADVRGWLTRRRAQVSPAGKVSTQWELAYGFTEEDGIAPHALAGTTADFLKSVSALPGVLQVLKYQDSIQHERARRYFEEIFDIEMNLRQVLNYILLYNDRDELERTFPDFNAATVPGFDKDHARQHFENEMFYVQFPVYSQFDTPAPLADGKVIRMLLTVSSIEQFFQNLRARPLTTERHRSFLSSIKDLLDSIEKLRNAIAHHRAFSKRSVDNYERSRDQLQQKIEDFWREEDPISHFKLFNGQYLWEEVIAHEVRELMQGHSLDAGKKAVSAPNLSGTDFTAFEQLTESIQYNLSDTYRQYAPPPDPESEDWQAFQAFDPAPFVEKHVENAYPDVYQFFRNQSVADIVSMLILGIVK
ncbi:MAG: Abi family protein [Saprospiraceae bacterium]|nr:Abi family protein [Saprospiraceae bacterium]